MVEAIDSTPLPARPRRGLARNTIWNLAGQTLPLAVALLTIPLLISGLGDDRFGVLSLAWVVIGYFGLFDLGLGRAMTRTVAEKLGNGDDSAVPVLFWTTMAFMLLLGVAGAGAGLIASPLLVRHFLTIPAALQHETILAFSLLALALPVDMTASGLRGAMEARQRFDLTSMMRVGTGLFTYVAPVVVLLVSHSLVAIVAVLVLGRLLAWTINLRLCLAVIPELRGGPVIDRRVLGPLLRMGGWMNVAGLVFPLMITLDRFLIGSLVSVASVAYYATPYEMVTKIWVLPTAIAGVLFPAFSATYRRDRSRTRRLFSGGVRYVFLGVFPPVLVIVTFAREGLAFWLNPDFAAHSGRILQILALGVVVNSLSNIPFALLDGAGRPDLVAKLHLTELPIYVASVVAAAHLGGIQGVAIVWLVRSVVDTALLFLLAQRLLGLTTFPIRPPVLVASALLLVAAMALFRVDPLVKVAFLGLAALTFAGAVWSDVINDRERRLVHRLLKATRVAGRLRPRLHPHLPRPHVAPGRVLTRTSEVR